MQPSCVVLLIPQAVQLVRTCLAGAGIKLTWDYSGTKSTPTYFLQFSDKRFKQLQAKKPVWSLDVLRILLLDAANKRSEAEKRALMQAENLVQASLPGS